MQHRSAFSLLITFLGGLLILFIVAPIAGMFLHTGWPQVSEALADSEVTRSIFLTLGIAMVTTLVAAVFAIPLAWLLARFRFRGKIFINALIDLPIVIPHAAAGIALLTVLSKQSALGRMAESLGFHFVGHPLGIGMAMAFVSLPFLINAARDGFAGVPLQYEQAAESLGASRWRIFYTIALPLAGRSIISGLVMMFARGISEFGAVVIIAYYPMVSSVLIFERFGAYGLDYARPIALLVIVVSLLFFVALRAIGGKRHV
jgi:molybdate/tungstate transport system permease protein